MSYQALTKEVESLSYQEQINLLAFLANKLKAHSEDTLYSEKTEREIFKSVQQIKQGDFVIKTIDELQAMVK